MIELNNSDYIQQTFTAPSEANDTVRQEEISDFMKVFD